MWSVLESGNGSESLEPFEPGVLSAGAVEGLQFGHGFTAVSDHERPSLTHLLQVSAEPGLELTDANRRVSWHVVMMTTSTNLVKPSTRTRCCVSSWNGSKARDSMRHTSAPKNCAPMWSC
jgi:hypothetical protein